LKRSRRDTDPRKAAGSIAVVAVGNRMVFGDQIGPKVLDAARGRYGPEVALIDAGSACFSLLDCIEKQDLMLVVDACNAGGAPGEIRVRDAAAVSWPEISAGTGLHQIGPLETMAIARRLFPERLPRRLLFILVETNHIDDARMNTASRQVLTVIDREIARHRADCGKGRKSHVNHC
jgi:hydrogenase maturation protease